MEKAREFFTHTLRTPEAMKLLEGIEKPASLEEIINVYADVARQLGTELTADEIKAYFDEKMNQPCAEGQVDDKEMTQVAGGKVRDECRYTYQRYVECTFGDVCALLFDHYETQACRYTYNGHENCWRQDSCNILYIRYDWGT